MKITVQEYDKILRSYYIYGCAVRDRTRFSFIVNRWYTDDDVETEEENRMNPDYRDKRLVIFIRDEKSGKQWGSTHFEGWGNIQIGAATKPLVQTIVIEKEETSTYIIGDGEKYDDTPVSQLIENPLRGGLRRIKMIDGYAYICGGVRSVGKRLGKGNWFSHTKAIPKALERGDGGFEDIAGFNEDDLYAVGGKGDVWRYDGKKWQQVAFPTNTWTTAVCCGADGNVYVSCYEGLTFMGRENRWTKIYGGGINQGFKDMVWHEGKVWCTNDNGVWTIENGELEWANDLPSEIYVCAGSLSVNDGVLLLAGLGGAAYMENGQWHSIFLRSEMEKAVRENITK